MKTISFYSAKEMFRLLTSLLFLALVLQSQAQMCSDPSHVIYGLTNSGKIVPIHVGDATVDAPLNVPYDPGYSPYANAMGYDPVNGKFYYFDLEAGAMQFVSFDPVTQQLTNLSTPAAMTSVVSGCVSMDGTGFYCRDNAINLYYYNIPSDTWTLITSNWTGPTGIPTTTLSSLPGGDMAIDGMGNLWIVEASSTFFQVLKVKAPLPTTPVASLALNLVANIQPSPDSGTSVDGIAFDPIGQIYLSTQRNLYLLKTDQTVAFIGTFSIASTDDMYDLTSCNFPFDILPVTWLDMSATLEQNREITVRWQYAFPSSPATGVFNVQRSTDGEHWKTIANEPAGPAASDTYSWLDAQPPAGRNYYRIQLTQSEGADNYSPVRVIELASPQVFTVSPNPVKNTLYVQYDGSLGNAMARILDVAGSVVEQTNLSTGSTFINVSNLSMGTYFIQLIPENGEPHIEKIEIE